jgi:hypothetical protein
MLQSLPGQGMRFPYIQVQVLKQLILGRSTRVANNLKPQHNGLDARMVLDTSWESFLRFLRIVCPAVVLVNSAIFFKFPFPSFKAEEQTTKTRTINWIWASLIHVVLCIYVCMCVYSYLCTWQTQIHDLACRSETSARRRRASMQIKNSTHATFEMTNLSSSATHIWKLFNNQDFKMDGFVIPKKKLKFAPNSR